jgi:hypothetical protein
VTRILRDQKIPVIAFVANTGGLLGLCMGFSLVSVFEIVYHMLGALRKWWGKPHQQPPRSNNGSGVVIHANNGESMVHQRQPDRLTHGLPAQTTTISVPSGTRIFFLSVQYITTYW